MWRLYALTACIALSFSTGGCEERGEVVAYERTGGASSNSGGSDNGTGGLGGEGGTPGLQRPQFGAPTAVAELNDPLAKDQDPTLTADELEIFFFSDRSGNEDIWKAKRASVDAQWDPPEPVPELNSDKLDQNPAISRDGLRIWFSSSRTPRGIYFASRANRDASFGAPELIPIDSGDATDFIIAPSVDITELRMAISIGSGASRDLYEVVRPSLTASWGPPSLMPGDVNGTNAESTPFLIDDGRELLFISGRSGGGDIFWAHRESLGLPTSRVEAITEVNDPAAFESHPHLTSTRARLYFGSTRGGSTDIYMAEAF